MKADTTVSFLREVSGQMDGFSKRKQQICCRFWEKFGCKLKKSDTNSAESKKVGDAIARLTPVDDDVIDNCWKDFQKGDKFEFRNHIDLIKFLFCSDPLDKNPEIFTEFGIYYS
eukprot:CAMPEP_0197833060 /NCGR_PEP_ID=MMETSP1437-20131217/17497_1 /TAXON_ID=49252 ORGANISM="Eucampia antarctica, Strain CCMP1452" /NCGR_SAMPLE_ID=MMETSP1437 /ASSEMBLY_ACC=CAM_ASM_001096 /LENGTH=113 /DNA_ID=CAMNT_0043436839 /DNA_START=278 /DNA_END=616 /DNA_ORIENTATION=-